ncbi:hypothetical protein MACJ_002385 [Theileria orientalis]|uniref:SfiI-subtelomeric related protein family member n=1 Tax=Theileria orientalis TaxID=68886 RepID=A0A976QSM7_THEOR|nr:hypothetical protein MACJ_002385 [Theileria orientalis]
MRFYTPLTLLITYFLWSRVRNLVESTATTKTGVDLNINSDTKSKDNFSYEKIGHYVTYTSKDNYAFKLVKDHKTEIWKPSDSTNYSDRVEVQFLSTYAKAITVFLADNKTRLFTRIDTDVPWNEIDTTILNLKYVNIDYPHESYFYKNVLQGETRIFTAKKGFAFKAAVEYIDDNIVTVWKTTNRSEYANKIVNEGDIKLTLHLANGSTKVIEKGSDGQWPRARSAPIHGATWTRTRISIPLPDDEDDTSKQSTHAQGTSPPGQPSVSSVPRPRSAPSYVFTGTRIPIFIPLEDEEDKTQSSKQPSSELGNGASTQAEQDGSTQPESGECTHPDDGDAGQSGEGAPTTPAPQTGTSTTEPQEGDSTQDEADDSFSMAETTGHGAATTPEQDGSTQSGSVEGTQPDDGGSGQSGDVTPTTPEDQSGSSKQPEVKLLKANGSDSANPLELGSNEYTSTTSNNVTSYNIANGINCAQLKIGDVLLWVYDSAQYGGIYPKSVDHDTTTNVLVLRFQGLDITFEKNDQGGWIFTESGPLAVKFHVVDPNDGTKTVELASNKFTLNTSGDVTTFTIANGVNCIKLLYSFVLLWEHDPNQRGGAYPKSLDFTSSTETLVLKFDGLDIKFEKNAGGEWEYTETKTTGGGSAATPESGGGGQSGDVTPTTPAPPTGSSTQPRVKLFKVNPSDATKFLELSASECTSSATGSVVSYHISEGVNCVQLMFDSVLLWVYDSTQHGGIYPKSVDHDTTTNVLVLRFQGLDITFEKNDQGGWIFTESGPLAVKFHVVDPNDGTKTVELASNKFTLNTSGDVTTFTIANGVNCIKLLYSFVLLWEHDPNQRGGAYPKSLDFTSSTETLVLKFDGLDIKFEKNAGGEWEYTETKTTGGGSAATPESGGGGQSGDVTPTTPAPPTGSSTQPRVKLFKVNPSDATKFLELSASECTSSATGSVVSYHISEGVNCVQLMFDSVLLWVYDSTQHGGIYPKSVDHDTTTNVLVLRFQGLDITFEKNDQGGWIFTESGPLAVKFHVVDPNDGTKTVELASNKFTLNTSGDVTTFTIANGVNCIKLLYSFVLLWEHDPNQRGGAYPKSLDFTSSTETLVLKFDGLDIKFEKNAGGEWEYTETKTTGGGSAATPESGGGGQSGDVTPTTPAPPTGSSTQPRVKLFKVNPSDATKFLELSASECTSSATGSVVSYHISEGVNCVQLMFDSVLLWVYDSTQHGGIYPKSVDHDTTTNVLVLRFQGLDITFEKNDQGGWIFTESGPLAVKFHVVDPNDGTKTVELASNKFTLNTSGDVTTFTIANDIKFEKNAGGEWEYTETDTSGTGAASTP